MLDQTFDPEQTPTNTAKNFVTLVRTCFPMPELGLANQFFYFYSSSFTTKQIFCSFSTSANVFSVIYGFRIILEASSIFISKSPLIQDGGI